MESISNSASFNSIPFSFNSIFIKKYLPSHNERHLYWHGEKKNRVFFCLMHLTTKKYDWSTFVQVYTNKSDQCECYKLCEQKCETTISTPLKITPNENVFFCWFFFASDFNEMKYFKLYSAGDLVQFA